MSFESDFEMVWKPFQDKLVSYVARNTAKHIMTDIDELRAFYKNALRIWEDPSKVQCGFISKWKSGRPGFEAAFMEALYNFEFQEPKIQNRPVSIYYAAAAGIAAAVGGLTGYLLPQNSFLKIHLGNWPTIIIAVLVFYIIGGSIIKSLYDAAVMKYCRNAADHYYGQLEALHKLCCSLCKKYTFSAEKI